MSVKLIQTQRRQIIVFLLLTLLLSVGLLSGDALAGRSPDVSLAGSPKEGAYPNTHHSGQPASVDFNSSSPDTQFDCSRAAQVGLEKQMNFHATQLLAACNGLSKHPYVQLQSDATVPYSGGLGAAVHHGEVGGTDQDASNPSGDGAYPRVTQSESMIWGHGNTIVVNYNDSRASTSYCYASYSYSTDGGATWTRPGGASGPSPICSGHGVNIGDPVVVYNDRLQAWFLGDLASGCGGQGIGLWTSTDGMNFVPGPCAHARNQDDRESMWVDNNPASPYYGRMYISWNDYASGGNIFVVHSDNGTSWTAPVLVQSGNFVRNVQVTGSPGSDGTVFVQGMNEGGGGLSNRTNIIYRSTDGGVTWTTITQGPSFPAPGNATCPTGYFAMVNPLWRYMGWGQPGVGPNNVVHYVYGSRGANGDAGDILYIRSTDNGSTWSSPVLLNNDGTDRTQWMPSLAVSPSGALIASWYDRRNTTNNDYEWYARVSTDNGVNWQEDFPVSDQTIPQPLQPDPNIQSCYAGDYNYHSADGNNAYMTWTDGRVLIGGNSQQDVFFDKYNLLIGTPTPTHTPCAPVPCTSTPTRTATPTRTPTITPTPTVTPCGQDDNYKFVTGTATITAGTNDIGNHCDDCLTSIDLPFPYTLYSQTFDNAIVSTNGQLAFITGDELPGFACLPDPLTSYAIFPHWDDLMTDTQTNCSAYPGGQCGIFTSVQGSAPNRTFIIEWRTIYYDDRSAVNFELILYEGQQRFDVVFGTVSQSGNFAKVGVQGNTGSLLYTQYSCDTTDLSTGLLVSFFQIPCSKPTPTITGTQPTETLTRTRTASPTRTATATCEPGGLSVDSSPNHSIPDDHLWGIAVVSANNVWAVGSYSVNGKEFAVGKTLIEHWDGERWSIVPSPNPGLSNDLWAVAALSANDAWAVGYYYDRTANRPLVLHWDGTSWNFVPSPSANPTLNNYLTDVAAVSANDVWAVGYYNGGGHWQTLTMHWDGAQWTIVPSPNPGVDANFLRAVAVVSANDVWAVGQRQNFWYQTLVLHWDGTAWNVVPSPNVSAQADSSLQDMSVVSANDIWAVGDGVGGAGHVTLTEHWNGTSWSIVPSPTLYYRDYFYGVAAVSANDVWAVGYGYIQYCCLRSVVVHWDGSAWSEVTALNPGPDQNQLWAVAATAYDVWPVGCSSPSGCGHFSADSSQTLVEHWRARTCGATPTRTPPPQGYIYGHLTWQNISQPLPGANEMTATLTLCSGGTAAYSGVVSTDESGRFQVSTGLPNGTYTWKLKGRRYIASGGTLTISGGTVTQEFGTQRAGDANNNNVVNGIDFNFLRAEFGMAGENLPADFDNNNVVNGLDQNLLRSNFGQAGVGLTCP